MNYSVSALVNATHGQNAIMLALIRNYASIQGVFICFKCCAGFFL